MTQRTHLTLIHTVTSLLPVFDDLDLEADRIEGEAFERLEMTAHEDTDPAGLAEAAFEAGLLHFELGTASRQALLNAFAVTLSISSNSSATCSPITPSSTQSRIPGSERRDSSSLRRP